MPVISSSEPPRGLRSKTSESSEGRTTHSRPRKLTRRPGDLRVEGIQPVLFADLTENVTASADQFFKAVEVIPHNDFTARIDDGLALCFIVGTNGGIVVGCAIAKYPHVW